MVARISRTFIDTLMSRVDIVEVIDRRVPLTRKGAEFLACCPFHQEKTPSFTVSPTKQFYHCFGCGAHGTAIDFIMKYANLSFVEAIQHLADALGLPVETEGHGRSTASSAAADGDLVKVVEQASQWFQQQLRIHPQGKQAGSYLKKRGLDGRTAANFAIGYAPDSWHGLTNELGRDPQALQQLMKAGLVSQKQANDGANNYYDRFRGRVMFPIHDYRGRVVAFGGRVLGQGEPKYLNSPETVLFHKGVELYGLHRARRAIDQAKRSVVVEGYLDVISLAQFGVDHVVATMGTATTRSHLQRLFRLANEIVFCFDGDRAGRSAAWKAMQVALPEMQDGRKIGFLFLPEGEDPDSCIRAEGKAAFLKRLDAPIPLPEFLYNHLMEQVDMTSLDGKARLVSLAQPLITQLPQGALREMVFSRLSSLSGLTERQLTPGAVTDRTPVERAGQTHKQPDVRPLSPLAMATSLLLQQPQLALKVTENAKFRALELQGAEVLSTIIDLVQERPTCTTAGLLESFRDSPYHRYLQKLAIRPHLIDQSVLEVYFKETLNRLLEAQQQRRRLKLLDKSRQGVLEAHEKTELVALFRARTADPDTVD